MSHEYLRVGDGERTGASTAEGLWVGRTLRHLDQSDADRNSASGDVLRERRERLAVVVGRHVPPDLVCSERASRARRRSTQRTWRRSRSGCGGDTEGTLAWCHCARAPAQTHRGPTLTRTLIRNEGSFAVIGRRQSGERDQGVCGDSMRAALAAIADLSTAVEGTDADWCERLGRGMRPHCVGTHRREGREVTRWRPRGGSERWRCRLGS
jgi:hypothetical protein